MIIEKQRIIQAIEDKKVICWSDLLEKLGLLPVFKKYNEENKKQYSIQNIFIGKTLLHWLDEIFKARIVKSKDKRVKHLREQYKLSALAWDALQSMPEESKEDIDYMELKGI